MTDLATIKDVVTVAAPLTNLIIETWVKPRLARVLKQLKSEGDLFAHSLAFTSKFDEYLLRSYERHSYVNVIVFQNQQTRLLDIYQPLTLQRKGRTNEVVLIGDHTHNFIESYRKILIQDTAGMGKSTLMKYLFISCLTQNEGIPILIELRKLKKDQDVVEYIYTELGAIDEPIDKDFILRLLKEGGFIFFLDGYDEIPFKLRDRLTQQIQMFISKASKNLFVLTSRPESSLGSFADFQEFNIRPLQQEEAFELLGRYDNNGDVSTELIGRLQKYSLQGVSEFLTNPLLVSLLYRSYAYKRTVAFKKHIFYRQVYDSLYETHDLLKGGAFAREKYSRLDLEDFHKVLRTLGFSTVKLGQVEFDKDSLLALITDTKKYHPKLDFKEAQFLKDLVTTVPLFVSDGAYYRWAHKSIQEYFAAQFVFLDSGEQKDSILEAMSKPANLAKYVTILDLYYDIDNKAFRRVITLPLINDFLNYFETNWDGVGWVPAEAVRRRNLATYGCTFVIFPRRWFPLHSTISEDQIRFLANELLKRFAGDVGKNVVNLRGHVKEFNLKNNKNFVYYVQDPRVSLLQLLHRKREDFIMSEPYMPKVHELKEVLLDFEDPFVVLPHIRSEGNDRVFFDGVTQMLFATFQRELLDVEKCRATKRDIEREIEWNVDSQYLTSGI